MPTMEAINEGLLLSAADELREINQRISMRSRGIMNARKRQRFLRDLQNEDLSRRARLVGDIQRRALRAGEEAPAYTRIIDEMRNAEGSMTQCGVRNGQSQIGADERSAFDSSLIAQHSALEHEAMNDINGDPDDLAQYDAGGEA